MKFSVFAVLLAAANVSMQEYGPYQNYLEIAIGCMKELGIKMHERGDEAIKKIQCLSKCIALNLGTMNDMGIIDTSKFPQIMKKDAEECGKNSSINTDVCARAGFFQSCILQKMDEKMTEYCAKETNTRLKEVDNQLLGPSEINEKKACFSRCMSMKEGALKENDEVNVESFKILGRIIVVDVDKAVKTCQEQNTQSDICIKSAKTVNCVREVFTSEIAEMFAISFNEV